jgi:hypothetical protein
MSVDPGVHADHCLSLDLPFTVSQMWFYSIFFYAQEMKEFWAFRDLLVNFTQQLSHCCTAELLPLMDLPAVKRVSS